jgi:hypothetical protein
MFFKFKKRNINMAKNNKNKTSSPFHKGSDKEGGLKRTWLGAAMRPGEFWSGDAFWGEDEWGIKEAERKMDTSFGEFQQLKSKAGENLWAGAQNLIDVQNYYGDVVDKVGGLENVMEDLTVNQQQAQFQREMASQQMANTMGALRGAGGGSGAAALAQSMSGIQAQQRQQIGAQIGQQESANQMARAQQAAQLQQLGVSTEMAEAKALTTADLAKDQGAMEAQKYQLQGAADARELQIQMQQAELSYLAGLKEAAEANKDSDRRLKKNIIKIGESNSGLNIYSFEYIDSKYGEGLFQGVMSDEIPQEAVSISNGYDMVDYSMLDVEFKQI